MKKFTSVLIGCSLALAGAAIAQQPEEQSSPKPHQAVEKAKGHPAEAKPVGPKTMKPAVMPVERHAEKNGPSGIKTENAAATPKAAVMPVERHAEKNGPSGIKTEKAAATPKAAPPVPTRTKVSTDKAANEATAGATPGLKAEEHRKGMKTPPAPAKPIAAPVAAATPAPPAAAAGAQKGTAKKPEPQQVQQIKAQHANFKAQPKPDKVPTVTFTENRRIEGSDRWQGRQYEAFRSYHSERHDQGWYHSHYPRVELIGGGYYYFNSGYWYPAWGYNDSQQYYAYDGPIYVGQRAEPLDRVIADVQGVLQEMGYYKGEVDGLLGPLTREALTSYQEQQGLAPTAAIDEPTLDALGMG